jgi:hypothetical protein
MMSSLKSVRSSAFHKSPLILPARTLLSRDGGALAGVAGMEQAPMGAMGMIPGLGGGDRGFHAAGDIVTQTQDGMDINELWDTYQRWLDDWNTDRDALVNFLTWNTTASFENLYQGGELADFEESTEYGEPVGHRPTAKSSVMGYPFKFHDLAGRFTWQYLADATSAQTDSFANMALEADSRLVFLKVMGTLFRNSRGSNKEGQTVYPFYSGEAGDTPPRYKMQEFGDNHNHFTTSGANVIDAPSLEALIDNIEEHGYTSQRGYNMVVLVNKQEGDRIRHFRSIPNGGDGMYDFVPAAGAPSFLVPNDQRVEGGRPGSSLAGLTVIGAYGHATVIQEDYIPAGYVVAFVTGGAESLSNPLAFRQHPTSTLQGLRLVKGRQPDYPLIDSFYVRGFGVGVRHRGAGAVMQVTTSPTYTVPATYANL